MFIVLILTATIVHGYINLGLKEATHRRNQIKVNHLRETFGKAYVGSHSISGLDAAARRLIIEDPVVENDRLHSWFDRLSGDYSPSGFGVEVVLRNEDERWVHISSNKDAVQRYVSRGTLSVSKVGGEISTVDVEVALFEIAD